MFKNYLKTAFRNIKKYKSHSIINMVGLAIGVACSLLIFLYVNYEFGFDKFHKKCDRIYRLAINASIGGSEIHQAYTSALTFQTLFDDYPEIESGVKMMRFGTKLISADDINTYYESGILAADSTFFDIFTIPLIHGTAGKALSEPNTIVLSEKAALKYFDRTNIVGETINIYLSEKSNFKITGVSQDVPDNSHFHYDFLISSTSFPGAVNSPSWSDNRFISYFLFSEGITEEQMAAINEKLKKLNEKYRGVLGNDGPVVDDNYWEFFLQPIGSIHLNSDLSGEFEANGNKAYVNIFLVIGIIILLIACINYMNLSTARASLRGKEVGIRKIVGSTRRTLVLQFLGESVLLSLIAMGLGLLIVELLLPQFRNMVGRPVEISYLGNLYTIPTLLILAIVVGTVSGFYPAFILSSNEPAIALKSRTNAKGGWVWLRNALIIFQFSISIFLIIGTLTINRQLTFMQNKNIGFDKEQVLIIKNRDALTDNIDAFKEELKGNADILGVSGSYSLPGQRFPSPGFRVANSDKWFTMNISTCDYDFMETIKLEMADGRFFSRDFGTDSTAIVLNQSACDLLGWTDPIGKRLNDGWNYGTYTVIGVVRDYNYESLHQNIQPMALLFSGGPYPLPERNISVRLSTGNISETIDNMERLWHRFAPNIPFQYSFLNEDFENLYIADRQTRQLTAVLTILALFISCIGLFGLASFIAVQKSREIGIRRVLGASIANIFTKLNSNFLGLILLSNLITWPVAWVVMNRWLENYAYRVNLNIWIFLTAGIAAITVALITVSFQSIKAALTDPATVLRSE